MKQLVILSGEGGTGKTSIAAAFAHLAALRESPSPLRAGLADANVDTANLELALPPRLLERHESMGGSQAAIDPARGEGGDVCAEVCRFHAVQLRDGQYNKADLFPVGAAQIQT